MKSTALTYLHVKQSSPWRTAGRAGLAAGLVGVPLLGAGMAASGMAGDLRDAAISNRDATGSYFGNAADEAIKVVPDRSNDPPAGVEEKPNPLDRLTLAEFQSWNLDPANKPHIVYPPLTPGMHVRNMQRGSHRTTPYLTPEYLLGTEKKHRYGLSISPSPDPFRRAADWLHSARRMARFARPGVLDNEDTPQGLGWRNEWE